ncbi:MAG: GlxA family transcriptional regulator [Candidatus Binatus sp.]|uniref:GlxA family transcriptional regulator n=1 Tax=Candidatus Binatus sp. TaxID=2811406 RepID=UPI0027220AE0|nr:GlxA family transcriptional regulator [Candidatus Binatus sp.]MDO8434194.1 GlxA family transcriptional regulator [Candidatus Binatus sp.]
MYIAAITIRSDTACMKKPRRNSPIPLRPTALPHLDLHRKSISRRVVMVAFDDAQVLDITGPLEVFGRTARLLDDERRSRTPAYAIELVASKSGAITTSSGLRLLADRAIAEVRGPIDTLIVAGGRGAIAALDDRALIGSIRRLASRVRRLCSVCTGAFLLAEAGLLEGRSATTHWRQCEALARRYPGIKVETDPIFVRDGNVFTSAGVTAGIDLALALVEHDHGRDIALAVARELVMFLRRPGGQSQFSVQLRAQTADREPLRELQNWIANNPGKDLSIEALARRTAMSQRNFARVFTREVGQTPGEFVENLRLETARRRLEESADGVDLIAAESGFGTRESMRRAFVRNLHVPPSAYRSRFNQKLSA